jgi:actin-related protein
MAKGKTIMSQDPQTNQAPSDKELNFRMLEQKYERQLQAERGERERLQAELAQRQSPRQEEPEDDPEPYVDHKKLNKTLAKFGEQTKQQTQSEIQKAVQAAISDERKNSWLNNNKDFYDVLKHAEKFAKADPELAETILGMPEGFERQKLVYQNIKALGLHKDPPKEPSIQEKVDANRKGPYYQPTSVGSAPYAGSQGDFSPQGKKAAYEKMQETKARLRLG